MARTAPVPNLPPIPGMCPGIAVLGGGGGSGGAGGKGAGSGGGGVGAGGEGGAEGADADGRGAGSCGQGDTAGGCPTHDAVFGAGHPVDVATGRAFIEPVVDVALPGPIKLEIRRSYSSKAHQRDVGLGFGWGHSLAWAVEPQRRRTEVVAHDGRRVKFPLLAVGDNAVGPDGWVLARNRYGYTLHTGGDQAYVFADNVGDGKRHRLRALQDRNGNRVTLTYDQDRLVEITDGAGRLVRVSTDPAGRILALDVKNAASQGKWVRLVEYAYDAAGNLVTVTDGDGRSTAFEYDGDHYLLAERGPTGLTWHFRYDDGRCVETWGDYPGRVDPSLDRDLPKTLVDGTPAKGLFHCRLVFDEDYCEVVDAKRLRRFFANEHGKVDKADDGGRVTTRAFDDKGNLVAATDPLGATTSWKLDGRGKILEQTDALGNLSKIERDAPGNVLAYVDEEGRTTRFFRDPNGNVLRREEPTGAVYAYKYDSRGLCIEEADPLGGTTRWSYDGEGNCTSITVPNGARFELSWDFLGRLLAVKDPQGDERRWVYNVSGDKLREQHKDGTATHFSYDRARNLVAVVDAEGRQWQYEYGGYHVLCGLRSPDGGVIRIFSDHEGKIVRVLNEKGEEQRYERDMRGDLVAETAFDGYQKRWVRDLMGQVIEFQDASGHGRVYTRDLLGRVAQVEYEDGSMTQFDFDRTGALLKALADGVEVKLERDALGRLIEDSQTIGGVTHHVRVDVDGMGNPIRRTSSLGLDEMIERDVMGLRTRTILDNSFELRHSYDLMGQEVRRQLPGGGYLDSEYDKRHRLTRRRAVNVSRQPPELPGQPDWVGPRSTGATVDRAFQYSALSNLTQIWDRDRGAVAYEYDPIGRLLKALPSSAGGELFRYDERGNPHEQGDGAPARSYGPGNRLLTRANVEYLWDDAGFLERKIEHTEDGDREWRYAWNGRGLLVAVDAPDGTRAEFSYDAFSRRLEKRVLKRDAAGLMVPVERTRFVWDGQRIAHEVRERAARAGDPVVEERAYAFEDQSFTPMAHRQERNGANRWLAYLCDPNSAPHALVEANGDPVWESERSVWGVEQAAAGAGGADTPLGFAGQYHDPETGLAYNRYRYYDPEAGRFLSRDPVELNGGINVYGYEVNPLMWVDPLGLTHFATADINGEPLRPATGRDQFDSTMTGDEFGALRTRNNPDGNEACDRRLCHTEQKACEAARNAGIGPGDTLTITGTKPPCTGCRGAMNDLAADTGADVVYNWEGDEGSGSWSTNQQQGQRAQRARERRRARATGGG